MNRPEKKPGGSVRKPRARHRPFTLSVKAVVFEPGGEERVLTLRRSAECSNNAGRWDLPGGKVEPGETVEQAIVREVAEETGLVIQPEKFLTALEWPTPHARIIYLYFYAHAKTTAVRMGPEHDRHEWLTFEEQTELKLAPHFKNLVEQMQAKQAANLVLERYLEQVENEQDGD